MRQRGVQRANVSRLCTLSTSFCPARLRIIWCPGRALDIVRRGGRRNYLKLMKLQRFVGTLVIFSGWLDELDECFSKKALKISS